MINEALNGERGLRFQGFYHVLLGGCQAKDKIQVYYEQVKGASSSLV